ncbi:MAG: OsmC family protein [Planctomycetota bacterium]
MAMVAEQEGLDFRGAELAVKMELAPEPARRIGAFTLTISLPRKSSESAQAKLAKAVELCHVRNSLRAEVAVNVKVLSPE